MRGRIFEDMVCFLSVLAFVYEFENGNQEQKKVYEKEQKEICFSSMMSIRRSFFFFI